MKIINNRNEISIDPDQWIYLNKNLDKEEIKELISDAIDDNNIALPMREITLNEAVADFQKLKSFKEQELILNIPFETRFEYSYDLSDMVIKSHNIGNRASDYFHQENRWKCSHLKYPSPFRSWHVKNLRMTLLNALWSLKMEEVNTTTLRSIIGLRKYIASQFRPSAAKAVYNYLGSENVLDFSSGWGDRLCGFYASNAKTYTGIDPNENLIPGYQDQIDVYGESNQYLHRHPMFKSKAGNDKTATMISGKAEDTYLDGTYDTIFTSPPYYNVERYTQEENQSWKKHKKFYDWMDDFLNKTIGDVWEHLESGGHMIINISDVYSARQKNDSHKICDYMNDYIKTLGQSNYIGCWGYEMRKRPNSGILKNIDGLFAEPMWVWQKK